MTFFMKNQIRLNMKFLIKKFLKFEIFGIGNFVMKKMRIIIEAETKDDEKILSILSELVLQAICTADIFPAIIPNYGVVC